LDSHKAQLGIIYRPTTTRRSYREAPMTIAPPLWSEGNWLKQALPVHPQEVPAHGSIFVSA